MGKPTDEKLSVDDSAVRFVTNGAISSFLGSIPIDGLCLYFRTRLDILDFGANPCAW